MIFIKTGISWKFVFLFYKLLSDLSLKNNLVDTTGFDMATLDS